ncbi:MAG: type II toxin-antitoxin system HicB family antitoxin [Theionarchaea archaeon]|nr:type II toxin-antitoxin system HicB family antitoxin [Theionarchaea archaeon]
MKLVFSSIIRKEKRGGYVSFCPELGVYSQGETIEEAKANLTEAVELYLESAKKLGILEEVLEEVGIESEDLKEDVLVINEYMTSSLQAQIVI